MLNVEKQLLLNVYCNATNFHQLREKQKVFLLRYVHHAILGMLMFWCFCICLDQVLLQLTTKTKGCMYNLLL